MSSSKAKGLNVQFTLGFIAQIFELLPQILKYKNAIPNSSLASVFLRIFHLREHLVKYEKGFSDGDIHYTSFPVHPYCYVSADPSGRAF